jgi:hypothetical protein
MAKTTLAAALTGSKDLLRWRKERGEFSLTRKEWVERERTSREGVKEEEVQVSDFVPPRLSDAHTPL